MSVICNFCKKEISNKYNLARHERYKHSIGIIYYSCDICEKIENCKIYKAKSKSDLKQHKKNMHESRKNIKCYYCISCSRQLKDKHVYSNHLKSKTHKMKLYKKIVCTECNERFVTKEELKKHNEDHEKNI